jgi:phosphoribosylanthranilate isomerase
MIRRPALKVCGHHHPRDFEVLRSVWREVDFAGFIFTSKSKRYVMPQRVAAWMDQEPRLQEKAVAVFMNQPLEEVTEVLRQTGICRVQLHGDESPAYCRALRDQVHSLTSVWKVTAVEKDPTKVGTNLRSDHLRAYVPFVDGILLDTKVRGQSGGTGQTFDWSVIPEVRRALTVSGIEGARTGSEGGETIQPVALMVAGGINTDNVTELVETYAPDGIDVAGGVEVYGLKDVASIRVLSEARYRLHG